MARLAIIAPAPPSGAEAFTAASLDGLKRAGRSLGHDIDVFRPVHARNEARLNRADLVIAMLGNSVEYHRDIYRHIVTLSGLVVLEDVALDGLVRGLIAAGDPLGARAAREALITRGQLQPKTFVSREPLRTPWCAHVVRRARGVIVHSEFGGRYMEEIGCRTPVFVAPYPLEARADVLRRAARRGARLRRWMIRRGADVVVGVCGELDRTRSIEAILGAADSLDARVHVLLMGRPAKGYDPASVVREQGRGVGVTLRPSGSHEDMLAGVVASDIVVDLHTPDRSQVGRPFVYAAQIGRPAVVGSSGAYLDWPDELVFRVEDDPPAAGELASVLGRLAGDPALRRSAGERARDYMLRLRSEDGTMTVYTQAIRGTLGLLADPVRWAVSRWAAALSECGVTEEMVVEEGYGVPYMESLRVFVPRPDGPEAPSAGTLLDSAMTRPPATSMEEPS